VKQCDGKAQEPTGRIDALATRGGGYSSTHPVMVIEAPLSGKHAFDLNDWRASIALPAHCRRGEIDEQCNAARPAD